MAIIKSRHRGLRLLAAASPLLLVISCVSQGSHTPFQKATVTRCAGTAKDRAEIEQAFENWYTAWKTKDYRLAAQNYSEDAIWVNAFGMKRVGRKEIERTLKEVFEMDFVMAGKGEVVEKSITFVRPDVALMTNRVERVGQMTASGAELPVRHTSHLRVFVKNEGRWQIVNHLISDGRSRSSPEH